MDPNTIFMDGVEEARSTDAVTVEVEWIGVDWMRAVILVKHEG